MKKSIIALGVSALAWVLFAPAAHPESGLTSHQLDLPASVPAASLRFSGWLVDEGTQYSVSVVSPPDLGTLTLGGDEFYVPGPGFDQVGWDDFVVDLEFLDRWGQLVTERHWIEIRRADVTGSERWTEYFETTKKEPDWELLGDQSLYEISGEAPIEGRQSLRIAIQAPSTLFLRYGQDGQSGDDPSAEFGASFNLPEPPPPTDPFGLDVMAISDGLGTLGSRVELRTVDDHWEARASVDAWEPGQPRLTTEWVTVPHGCEIRVGLLQAPELIGKPGAADFVSFFVDVGSLRYHESWLFGAFASDMVLDVGVLDVAGTFSSHLVIDGIEVRESVIETQLPTQ